MTPGFEPFLRAIIAAPDDDLPRLIAADWLEETAGMVPCPKCAIITKEPREAICNVCLTRREVSNGHGERAAFIRVQCELATLPIGMPMRPPPPMKPVRPKTAGAWNAYNRECRTYRARVKEWDDEYARRDALRRRERELLTDDNRTRWFAVQRLGVQLGDDPNLSYWWIQPGGPRIKGVIRRGFVEAVTCTAADWLAHGDAITARTPIAEVTLRTWPDTGKEFDGRPLEHEAKQWLSRRWPRVKTWNLPNGALVDVPNFGELLEEIRQGTLTINEARA